MILRIFLWLALLAEFVLFLFVFGNLLVMLIVTVLILVTHGYLTILETRS